MRSIVLKVVARWADSLASGGECVPKYIYVCVCASGAAEEQGTHCSVADFDTNVPDLVFLSVQRHPLDLLLIRDNIFALYIVEIKLILACRVAFMSCLNSFQHPKQPKRR